MGHVGRVCYHSPILVCAGLPARHTFPAFLKARFPPTKTEARGIAPGRILPVWHRLPRILLASPPLLVRLGLAPLSFLPAKPFLQLGPRRSHPSVGRVTTPWLPAPAALKELTHTRKPRQGISLRRRSHGSFSPTDRIFTRFVSRPLSVETGMPVRWAFRRCSLEGQSES